jgi:GntR family transcriptional regulator
MFDSVLTVWDKAVCAVGRRWTLAALVMGMMEQIFTEKPEAEDSLQVTLVERNSPIPAYLQVENDLRRLIRSGTPLRFPSEIELAKLYGVSRVTVRQALERLAAAGLVKREHGRGTTVVSPPELALDLTLLRGINEELRAAGVRGRVQLLEQRVEVPPVEIAAALHMQAGEQAVLLRRLAFANDVPLSINRSWFPLKLVPGLDRMSLENASVWSTLAEHHGIQLVSAESKIEVVESQAEESRILQVSYEAPLIRLMRCFLDQSQRRVEYSISLWRTNQMRLSFIQKL